MTRFEKLVSGGPEAMAILIAKTKLASFKKAFEAIGVEYDLPQDKYEEILVEHYKYLAEECEEEE